MVDLLVHTSCSFRISFIRSFARPKRACTVNKRSPSPIPVVKAPSREQVTLSSRIRPAFADRNHRRSRTEAGGPVGKESPNGSLTLDALFAAKRGAANGGNCNSGAACCQEDGPSKSF